MKSRPIVTKIVALIFCIYPLSLAQLSLEPWSSKALAASNHSIHPSGDRSLTTSTLKLAQKTAATSQSVSGPGVRVLFQRAQKLYSSKDYKKAFVAYDKILRRYPGHEPSTMQLAKTLYRLDRFKDSKVIFERLRPEGLDPETAYEYGFSFYQVGGWKGAIRGFDRVPKGHGLYDLASYYSGVAAIKLRQYDDAESRLERALVLPDKLSKSRGLYLRHVSALKTIEQKSRLSRDRRRAGRRFKSLEGREQGPISQGKLPSNSVGQPAMIGSGDASSATDSSYDHQGLETVSQRATLAYTYEGRNLDNHGYQQTSFSGRTAAFNLTSGYLHLLKLAHKDQRRTVVGGRIGLSAEDTRRQGDTQRLIIQESSVDLSRLLSEELEVSHTKAGAVAASLFLETPLPERSWWSFGGNIAFTYPDFERGSRSGVRAVYTQLSGSQNLFTYSALLKYEDILNQQTKPSVTRLSGKLKGTYAVAKDLSLTVQTDYTYFDYLQAKAGIDGPNSVTGLSLAVVQSLPYGFALTGQGSLQWYSAYLRHGLPTYGTLSSDAQVSSGLIKLSGSPFSVLNGFVQGEIINTVHAVDFEPAKEVFELNVPSYVTISKVGLEVALTF